eukprot:TRINITY_DN11890_c0_g1_i1.p1 TRINITY_DN11890_c0_g1~~TRINITY_DN11890_c0_g1_i1.p1  ORF type:complete len:155 (-),score=47.33 TRINITY_DN11890_c0_g1_i1:23-487(-)
MGGTHPRPPRPTNIPAQKTVLCVSGFTISHHTGRARRIADEIQKQYPDKIETWYYFGSGEEYRGLLDDLKKEMPADNPLQQHRTSPFCWLEFSNGNPIQWIGGRDRLCEWAQSHFSDLPPTITELISTGPSVIWDVNVNITPGTLQPPVEPPST